MDQRLFTPFVLGARALKLLFEFRIGFTPEERQVVNCKALTSKGSGVSSDFYDLTCLIDSSKADLADYLCLTPLIDFPIVRLTAAIEGFGNLRRT